MDWPKSTKFKPLSFLISCAMAAASASSASILCKILSFTCGRKGFVENAYEKCLDPLLQSDSSFSGPFKVLILVTVELALNVT